MSPSRNMRPLQQIKPWDLEVASATDFLEGCKSGPAYNGGGTCDDMTWPKSGGAVTTLWTRLALKGLGKAQPWEWKPPSSLMLSAEEESASKRV